ncbi:MAG TPA: sigma-70 family RNA polymerase sigma factor [Pyrinomonadaceae bacterium]|nr:sigma-70 family RNA polymerase sigma factor [Pyrinomonadaceae bacterium]
MGHPQQSFETPRGSNELVILIKGVVDQDQHAMAKLYDATSRLVYGLVLRIVGDPSAAEEVLVDVYMQAWRQASRYSEDRGSPMAWLTTIARSRALDRLRSGSQDRQRSQPLELVAHQAASIGADDAAMASELQKFVHRALDSLSPEQREVIELAYYRGLSHREIASGLGQPLGTVKTRTRLGMIKLREMLKPLTAEGIL